MDWFIADTHYAHKNIIRGVSEWPPDSGQRPFDSFEDHNSWLVNMINEDVKHEDVLWHLGDWSFGGIQRIAEFRRRLNVGTVRLVLGNHDHNIIKANEEAGGTLFDIVSQYVEYHEDGVRIVLMHYPIESWNQMERGAVHLHGHVHGKVRTMQGRYDVGVDALGLISLEHVQKLPKANEKRHGREFGGNKFGT